MKKQFVFIFIFLVWITIFLGLVFLNLPFQVYLDFAESSWDPIDIPTYPEYGVTAIDFVNSNYGWLGGEEGVILASTDGGQSWTEQNSGINSTILAIDFFSPQIGVAISQMGLILITQNGGENWTLLEIEAGLWDITICDEQIAWLLGAGGSLFQVNITQCSWIFISKLNSSLFNIAMLNRTYGWASGGSGQIVRTCDGWQSFELQESGVSIPFYEIFFWNEYKGWVVGSENIILATTDGGENWVIQHKPYYFFSAGILLSDILFISEDEGWAVGSYGIHYTENGGTKWNRLPNTSGPRKIAFANDTHGWAVAKRKDQSFFTRTGGTPPLNATSVNTGFGVIILGGIVISFLIIGTIKRIQH